LWVGNYWFGTGLLYKLCGCLNYYQFFNISSLSFGFGYPLLLLLASRLDGYAFELSQI
jgi:hypothetical protein